MNDDKLRINNSRYGDKRYLEKIGKKEYLLYGKSIFNRWIGDDLNAPSSIDFEGGPFVSIDDNLKDFGASKDLIVAKLQVHPDVKDMSCFKITIE